MFSSQSAGVRDPHGTVEMVAYLIGQLAPWASILPYPRLVKHPCLTSTLVHEQRENRRKRPVPPFIRNMRPRPILGLKVEQQTKVTPASRSIKGCFPNPNTKGTNQVVRAVSHQTAHPILSRSIIPPIRIDPHGRRRHRFPRRRSPCHLCPHRPPRHPRDR